jgi:hypothetical protein
MDRRSSAPPHGGSTSITRTSTTLAFIAAALLSSGCARDPGDGREPPEENAEAAAWRVDIRSTDPIVRARAVDLVPGAPGEDGVEALEEVALSDPDARVREQAVLAYAQVAGRDATTLLKDIALGDESESVASAALASLEKIREQAAEPPRAWMDVDFPDAIAAGEAFDVRVRFGSAEAAPKAMLQLRLPDGFAAADGERWLWKGELVAGQAQEAVFHAVAPNRKVQSSARVRLHVDYADPLDLDLLNERVRIALDDTGGRFESQPAPIRRSP